MGRQSRMRRDAYRKANAIVMPPARVDLPQRSGKVNPPRRCKGNAGNMQKRKTAKVPVNG